MSALETIVEQGEEALVHHWDSGGPGAGGGIECVYCYDGRFAVANSEFENEGPFGSLNEAIEQTDVLFITDASSRIECDTLSVTEILRLLKIDVGSGTPSLDINGTTCEFDTNAEKYMPQEAERT